ncbi:hypothetical protein P3T37_004449 [Kitasatospora sp. MAA4]|uniref:hypothetical protein n=1 Tax=Kitasatospora sp. MAA4 TaxID=3035093 RepID=UPI0024771EA1|nr:hypothetical protein [Kitasatospora sp. MAA4]MDH6135039.1 hypothetical protein [Kitasatospora sp. MAA4]
MDLSDLADEIQPGLHPGQYRFLYAIIAPMAQDAFQLARDLETALVNEAAENGVELPPLDTGGGAQ